MIFLSGENVVSDVPIVIPAAYAFNTYGSLVSSNGFAPATNVLPVIASYSLTAIAANCVLLIAPFSETLLIVSGINPNLLASSTSGSAHSDVGAFVNLTSIVCFSVTFSNLYVSTLPTDFPSTRTSSTTYPAFGVNLNSLSLPFPTLGFDGVILPPSDGLVVIL